MAQALQGFSNSGGLAIDLIAGLGGELLTQIGQGDHDAIALLLHPQGKGADLGSEGGFGVANFLHHRILVHLHITAQAVDVAQKAGLVFL